MKTIADRILHRRKELQMSQRELGRRLNIAGATISLWESERNYPNGENLLKLAKALSTTPEWLQHGQGVRESKNVYNVTPSPEQPSIRKLPIISPFHAGDWDKSIDLYASVDKAEWEIASYSTSTNAFWLRVVGDSMASPLGLSITEGMLILVNPDVTPENGKLVVAKLENTEEVTFKKLVIDAGQKYLKPLNPAYPPLHINDNCRIVGVVTELKLKL
ncbi:LexA family protein [Marinomonas transparens]|uniref:Helix-turn-helix domain-containing protein n=1 Tax=Marinomonas transparens TaxID=2795388 RepID=A0A934N0R8_9GAMM|nr:S24 family peptidase [Marinomonas transparens]MBJ7536992.1 helix-turn-helix domain-containing protein [Marinomonas transparens]